MYNDPFVKLSIEHLNLKEDKFKMFQQYENTLTFLQKNPTKCYWSVIKASIPTKIITTSTNHGIREIGNEQAFSFPPKQMTSSN